MTTRVTIMNHGPKAIPLYRPGSSAVERVLMPGQFADVHVWTDNGHLTIGEAADGGVVDHAGTKKE